MGSVALAGCTIGGSSNSKKKKSSSHSTGLTTDTSGESSESSGSGSSGSSTSGSSGSSSSAPSEYTAEYVAGEFGDNLVAEDFEEPEYDEEYKVWYGGVIWSDLPADTSESNLKSAVEPFQSLLPEYMAENYAMYGDPTSEDYEPLFEDEPDLYYYYVDYLTPDKKVYIAIFSYIYNNACYCQYEIGTVKASSN